MTPQLFDKFNTLKQAFQLAAEDKQKTLTRIHNLLSFFDENSIYTNPEDHIEGSWAINLLEDAGYDFGVETYLQLQPKLIESMYKEKFAKENMVNFLANMNLNAPTEYPWELNLEALAIRNGKIITKCIGNA